MRRLSAVPIALLALLAFDVAPSSTSPRSSLEGRPIAGTYSDEQLAAIGRFTLPRVFLYDGNGALIPQEKWPLELGELKRHAGEAFCCVSETPPPPGGGPPPDCEVIVYGAEVRENFAGLLDKSGHAITYESLPKHEYLLVEYYATWCQPCVAGRKSLETFFDSPARAKGYVWVSIDMSRLADAKESAKARFGKPSRPGE